MTTSSLPDRPDGRSVAVLLGLLALCVGGGAVIGVAFAGQTDAYTAYDLPSWAPPSWLFGPVWTALYAAMAVGAWRVWRTDHPARRTTLVTFGVQLVLNFAWTPAFFGASSPVAGLVVIVAVLLAVLAWTRLAWRVDRPAGLLQLPYVAWVAFATALNAAIVA